MHKFTEEMVDAYADQLLIGLTREENKNVLDEFDMIDKNCDIVNQIPNIEKVEPMTHCLDAFVVDLRDDEATASPTIDELLQNADEISDREIELPKVVG